MKINRNNILIAIVVVFFGIAATSCACEGRNKSGAESSESVAGEGNLRGSVVIEISAQAITERKADTISLGTMREGEVVRHSIRLKNTDSKPMVITGMDVSCGCTAMDYSKKPIMPGEESEITLQFDSKGLSGWAYKTVLMHTSLSDNYHRLVITAQVR